MAVTNCGTDSPRGPDWTKASAVVGRDHDHGIEPVTAATPALALCAAALRATLKENNAMDNETAVIQAAEPWADYHGPIPDYDHPLRPVFESGVQYTVELLAKVLGVEDYEICDGTEEFDGDLAGTLLNIVIKTWLTDEDGDWIDQRVKSENNDGSK